jgi:hypothetical protein
MLNMSDIILYNVATKLNPSVQIIGYVPCGEVYDFRSETQEMVYNN